MNNRFEDQMEENASLLQRLSPSSVSRRRVLIGGGAGALALVAAACGGDDTDPPQSTGDPETTTTTSGGGGGGGDIATAKLAASLEVLAVNTYEAALSAAQAGDLGTVPPAVATFATVARDHHQAHLDAWNELLTTLGEEAVSEPPPELDAMVSEELGQVAEAESPVVAVAELALTLEQTASDTYFDAIPGIENAEALALAASIQPIDMQHAAILHYVMGEYPVPLTFADTEQSALSA